MIRLVREALVQLRDPKLRPLGRVASRVPVEQLLVGGQRGLPVGRIELRAAPEVGIYVAHPQQRLGGDRMVRRVVRRLPKLPRRFELPAPGKIRLTQPVVRLGDARISRGKLQQHPLEQLLRRHPTFPCRTAASALRQSESTIAGEALSFGREPAAGATVGSGRRRPPPHAASQRDEAKPPAICHRRIIRAESNGAEPRSPSSRSSAI